MAVGSPSRHDGIGAQRLSLVPSVQKRAEAVEQGPNRRSRPSRRALRRDRRATRRPLSARADAQRPPGQRAAFSAFHSAPSSFVPALHCLLVEITHLLHPREARPDMHVTAISGAEATCRIFVTQLVRRRRHRLGWANARRPAPGPGRECGRWPQPRMPPDVPSRRERAPQPPGGPGHRSRPHPPRRCDRRSAYQPDNCPIRPFA
jgi:hypothetical protein